MNKFELPWGKGRAPTVSGIFYPDDKAELADQIQSFGVCYGVGGRAAAIIAPHGAWNLSGSVAGRAFSAAAGRERPERDQSPLSQVVLLGNIHDSAYEGIFLSDSEYFDTPLGPIPVNRKLINALASCSTIIEVNDIPHLMGHTLEVMLPFIKYCFPRVSIIPILMSCIDSKTTNPSLTRYPRGVLISSLASALRIILEPIMESTLIVVSANLSNHADPEKSQEQAEACVQLLEAVDSAGFITALHEGQLRVCGGGAVAALLESGLLAGKTGRLVSGRPLIKALGEENAIVHYGSISYE